VEVTELRLTVGECTGGVQELLVEPIPDEEGQRPFGGELRCKRVERLRDFERTAILGLFGVALRGAATESTPGDVPAFLCAKRGWHLRPRPHVVAVRAVEVQRPAHDVGMELEEGIDRIPARRAVVPRLVLFEQIRRKVFDPRHASDGRRAATGRQRFMRKTNQNRGCAATGLSSWRSQPGCRSRMIAQLGRDGWPVLARMFLAPRRGPGRTAGLRAEQRNAEST